MTMATKHEVLREHLKEWLDAKKDKKQRAKIIHVVCDAIRMHPKSVPRAFRRLQMKKTDSGRHVGRPMIYTPDVLAALKEIWEVGDQCCGELLHPLAAAYVSVLKRDGQWNIRESTTRQLLTMSLGTMKRRLRYLAKKQDKHHGQSTTRPSSLKAIIPIFKGPWKDVPPGTGQIDTVAHCGDSLLGDFIFSVNYTDAATYWIVPRAQWNKGQAATIESIKAIRERIPFPLHGLHPDTGSEFINWNLRAWCKQEAIDLTRSEPGKKNDNMFVEERNGHVVRRYLGYVRYDQEEIVPFMNKLYDVLALYLNHWKAVRRQTSKERVGSKYVRRYERDAKTPYARAMEHSMISDDVKRQLYKQHTTLNPLNLKRQIDTLIMKIYKLQQTTRNQS